MSIDPSPVDHEDIEDGVVQIVTSVLEEEQDGTLSLWLASEDPAWPSETGLRLTENDALALCDELGQAARLMSGADPQRFLRLIIADPPRDISGLFRPEQRLEVKT